MLPALLRYKRGPARRRKAQEWNALGRSVRAHNRMNHGPSFESRIWRAKQDRRGELMHTGHLYRSDGRVQKWEIRRSRHGRTDQFDVTLDGMLWVRGGREKLYDEIGFRVDQEKPCTKTCSVYISGSEYPLLQTP